MGYHAVPCRQGCVGNTVDTEGSNMTTLTVTGRQCTVVLSGPLDVTTDPDVYLLVDHLLAAGVTGVVLDLARVDFCNAAGARVLVAPGGWPTLAAPPCG